jgi:hypothetical protein
MLASAAFGCRSSRAQNAPAATGDDGYDPKPMLASVRPEQRAALAQAIGVRGLEDLPLYDLDMSLDGDLGTFTLKEQLFYTNTTGDTLSDVVLRIYANATSAQGDAGPAAAPVAFLKGDCTGSLPCTVTADSASALTVRPATPLLPGARLRVNFALKGTLDKIDSSRTNLMAQGIEGMKSLMGGEAGGNYGTLAMGDGIASFANFFPVIARRVSGNWQRGESSTLGDLGSDDLAHVRARVELPAKAKLATTGVALTEEPVAADRRRVAIVAGCVRDFGMLASFGIETASRQVGGVEVRSHFLAAERTAGERVLDVAAAALADYEKRFGPYPYTDLDVVEAAIVGGAGGVEFSGLVTAASMLYHPKETGGDMLGGLLAQLGAPAGGALPAAMTDSMLEFVVAHEVAHQWWHGLVGSDSRVHPFVDEALAQYSAMLYLEDRYGRERAAHDAATNVKMNYQMMRIMGAEDASVDQPVESFLTSITYAGIIYGKAPYFFAALRHAMGDAPFFRALHDYTERYRWKSAPARGLVDVAATGDDAARLKGLAAHWLDEKHGDEDLGKADLMQMVGSMLGPDVAQQLGPLMQMFKPEGDDAPAPPASPSKPKRVAPKPGL